MPRKAILLLIASICIVDLATQRHEVLAEQFERSVKEPNRLAKILSSVKRVSNRGFSVVGDFLASVSFTKIAIAAGALLSIFLLFVRLLVVLGPILILGAMTRESTESTDLIRMLIEFYNQIIVALDEQHMSAINQPQSS